MHKCIDGFRISSGTAITYYSALASFININGKLSATATAAVPHDNRAFRYGYGLFETLLFRKGMIELEAYHWARLFAGMEQLGFDLSALWLPGMFSREVARTVQKNRLEALCRVRLQVWNGNGGLYDGPQQPQYLIECFALDEEVPRLNENGLTVGMATGIYKSCDALARLKSCNAMIYAVAAQQARANRWNDALILNDKGRIAETTIANIFWVKQGTVFTPPLEEGCVAGVVRQHLLSPDMMKIFPIKEQPLSLETLTEADEIFTTNAIRKVRWVSLLGAKSYRKEVSAAISHRLNH